MHTGHARAQHARVGGGPVFRSCPSSSDSFYVGLDGDTPHGSELDAVGLADLETGDRDSGSSSGRIASLLQDLSPMEGTSSSSSTKGGGIYVGDSLPPIPPRIAAKVCRWEFVEMYELLPEFWVQKEEETNAKAASRAKAKRRIQDINVWLQCFGLYVSVLATQSPQYVPELMAYMVSILRASQEYEGSAWTTYDAAYRRQAAATGNKQWSKVNPSLYTVCFTGKARKATRCDLCLSAAHKTEDCHLTSDDDPDLAKRVRAVESAVVAFSGRPQGVRIQSTEICRLFNERRCKFKNCKYRHVCHLCASNHPAIECPLTPKQSGQPSSSGPGPMRMGRQQQHQLPGFPY